MNTEAAAALNELKKMDLLLSQKKHNADQISPRLLTSQSKQIDFNPLQQMLTDRSSQLSFDNLDSASDIDQPQRYQMSDNYNTSDDNMNMRDDIVVNLTRVERLFELITKFPWPRMSFTAMGIYFLIGIFVSPRLCIQNILFPIFRLVFGTLYPAYASYKAVRTKNVKEYVKWMMYWIVFAFFTCIETFTDIFLSWLPLYYEVKVIVVLWLLNPATKGSSVLYRKFVHPMLTRREQEIDEYLNQAKERGYTAVIQLGSKGVNYATKVIMQSALKGGGNLVQTIKRSYSLSDLSEPDVHRTQDEVDELTRPQHRGLRPRTQVGRSSSSGARHSTGMYFSEMDVAGKGSGESLHYNIKSTEDISSGYSSAEPISGGLSRTSSMTSSRGLRFRAKKPEDETFSEYDENDYIIREHILSELANKSNSTRSHSLSEFDQQILLAFSTKYQQNPLKHNFNKAEINSNLAADSNLVDNFIQKKQFPYTESESPINLKSDESKRTDTISNEEKTIVIPPKQMDPEMQAKFEMFCQWLDKGENLNDVKKENKIEKFERQISDDDFKDTISVESIEDNSLEKFDDALSNDLKNNDFNEEIVLEFNFNEETKENNKMDNIQIPFSSVINQNITQEKSQLEESTQPTLKQNISIAVDSVTKLKEHILKLNDGRPKVDSENAQIVPTQSLNDINSSKENLENNTTNLDLKEEINLDTNISENKRPVYHTKGKAPEPPLLNSISSNFLSSSDLFKTFPPLESSKSSSLSSYSPLPMSFDFSDTNQTTVMSNTNSRPSTPLSTSTYLSENASALISSRSSPISESVTSSLAESTSQLQAKTSSHSRSPSPKPIVKPRRNIFRSYLPSIFRSESPKSKGDEDYLGKETEI